MRLENERIVTEQEIEKMNEELANDERPIRPTETLTTTAPRGASADAIRDGVRQVEQSREASGADTPTPEQAAQGTNENTAGDTTGSTAGTATAGNSTTSDATTGDATTGGTASEKTAASQNEAPAEEAPKRSKSKLGAWARSASKKTSSSSKAEPYPGT